MLSAASTGVLAVSTLRGIAAPVLRAFSTHPKVNGTYRPGGAFPPRVPQRVVKESVQTPEEILSRDSARRWTRELRDDVTRKNTLFTWGATGPYAANVIHWSHGEGNYLVDIHGKKYLDFNSQAMCSHYGHSNDEIKQAIIDAVSENKAYAYPCTGVQEIKLKLSALLADYFPGDINTFFYTSGGTEANESAIRMVRQATGRQKIMVKHRGYHGGTNGSMALCGDFRRWPVERTGIMPGVVRVPDPYMYHFDWGCGDDEELLTKRSLDMIEETILMEGPNDIAAFWTEPVVGTNGIFKFPKGYLEGLRAILDRYGILMVADEVMSGFGRTGKRFGYMHTDPLIAPDLVVMAKGINGAYLPLGALGLSDSLGEYFQDNPTNIGSTYGSHGLPLASAYAAIKYSLEHKLVERAAAMQPLMEQHMSRLCEKYSVIKQTRAIGLFGVIEPQRNQRGDWFQGYNNPPHPAILKFKKALGENGIYTMMRNDQLFCNPPLVISEEELEFGFNAIDQSLPILQEAMED